ncbi:unnamed protein product [Schistocephalus solidus]|uniref:Uncharacterized protein n=1 Tax=Schistocephalus solidus TaxID=70667 RepID=A0A183SR47_SCHSO|nr:unnamed protein product [Schistocephalus solidus]
MSLTHWDHYGSMETICSSASTDVTLGDMGSGLRPARAFLPWQMSYSLGVREPPSDPSTPHSVFAPYMQAPHFIYPYGDPRQTASVQRHITPPPPPPPLPPLPPPPPPPPSSFFNPHHMTNGRGLAIGEEALPSPTRRYPEAQRQLYDPHSEAGDDRAVTMAASYARSYLYQNSASAGDVGVGPHTSGAFTPPEETLRLSHARNPDAWSHATGPGSTASCGGGGGGTNKCASTDYATAAAAVAAAAVCRQAQYFEDFYTRKKWSKNKGRVQST